MSDPRDMEGERRRHREAQTGRLRPRVTGTRLTPAASYLTDSHAWVRSLTNERWEEAGRFSGDETARLPSSSRSLAERPLPTPPFGSGRIVRRRSATTASGTGRRRDDSRAQRRAFTRKWRRALGKDHRFHDRPRCALCAPSVRPPTLFEWRLGRSRLPHRVAVERPPRRPPPGP
jgi:hypothetical protein